MTPNRRNYYLLVLANSVAAVFGGFSVPFFIVFFFEFGGSASVLATAVAIQGIFTAVASSLTTPARHQTK